MFYHCNLGGIVFELMNKCQSRTLDVREYHMYISVFIYCVSNTEILQENISTFLKISLIFPTDLFTILEL